jgi:hypothetical protein
VTFFENSLSVRILNAVNQASRISIRDLIYSLRESPALVTQQVADLVDGGYLTQPTPDTLVLSKATKVKMREMREMPSMTREPPMR